MSPLTQDQWEKLSPAERAAILAVYTPAPLAPQGSVVNPLWTATMAVPPTKQVTKTNQDNQ
jgi:hypothetical protein